MLREYMLNELKKIREKTRRELDCPPDPPVVTGSPSDNAGKISDVATFVTDVILK